MFQIPPNSQIGEWYHGDIVSDTLADSTAEDLSLDNLWDKGQLLNRYTVRLPGSQPASPVELAIVP